MLELHSWLTVRATYENEDLIENYDEKESEIIDTVKKLTENCKYQNIQLQAKNGEFYIETSIFANRKSAEFYELMDLYKKIVTIAKGSYGIIYLSDDEDENGRHNEFQVYVMKRGEIFEKSDKYLSPFIPTIEDEV